MNIAASILLLIAGLLLVPAALFGGDRTTHVVPMNKAPFRVALGAAGIVLLAAGSLPLLRPPHQRPTPPPTPSASPSLNQQAVARLEARIPADVRKGARCEPMTSGLPTGVTAAVACGKESADAVPNSIAYVQFTDKDTMRQWADETARRENRGGTFKKGPCTSTADFPSRSAYSVEGARRGEVYCFFGSSDNSMDAVMLWTDEKYSVLMLAAETRSNDFPKLVQWWQGPDSSLR